MELTGYFLSDYSVQSPVSEHKLFLLYGFFFLVLNSVEMTWAKEQYKNVSLILCLVD